MTIRDLIRKKRDGGALSKEELTFFANAAANGTTPDYQLSALLMAIFLRGLDPREMVDLTLAMAHSGDMADLSSIRGVTADKHSTGGVGDKTSLVVAPIVAACGVKMAKMSGRGLGHTGGTVDKLESIPGFRTSLTAEEFCAVVNETGICVVGQSGNLCPADKALYALRDVTETVASLPLIASSIMSKKLAGGAQCLVLDVKCGSGAFMQTLPEAKALAEAMVDIGVRAGRKTAALITNMDQPLGNAVGNSVEVQEAIETLAGNGPEDLKTVCFALASQILQLAGFGNEAACNDAVKDAVESGRALQKLADMVRAQGGDERYIFSPELFTSAACSTTLYARDSGFITLMNTFSVGNACVALGAGRQVKTDTIDPTAGIRFFKKTGDAVTRETPVAELFCGDAQKLAAAKAMLDAAISYGSARPAQQPMIFDVIAKERIPKDV